MKAFEEMTRVSSSDAEKISYIVPAVATLHSYLSKRGKSKGIQIMKDELRKSLESRFMHGDNNVYENKILILSTFLDPRSKGNFLKDGENVKKVLCDEIRQNLKAEANTKTAKVSCEKSPANEVFLDKQIHEDIWSCFDEILDTKGQEQEEIVALVKVMKMNPMKPSTPSQRAIFSVRIQSKVEF